jgi:ubiquinone/menaquinone biosynthesis C-methylase UbiE
MAMPKAVKLPIFDVGARAYDVITAQDHWREQIARVLLHVPASEGPDRDGLRVLDLGCGPGVSSFVLAERLGGGAQVTGVDISKTMIGRAQRHHGRTYAHLGGISFEVADATRMRFGDGSFDLAVGHSFLYLVGDRAGVLREVRRVLAPGGSLVLMEPNAGGSLLAAARRARRHAGELLRRPWSSGRFVTSMALWRVASRAAGRIGREQGRKLFHDAGFRDTEAHPTLGGLGLHLVGRV